MKLTAPNGATVEARDEAVDRLLAAGFKKAAAPKKEEQAAKPRKTAKTKEL